MDTAHRVYIVDLMDRCANVNLPMSILHAEEQILTLEEVEKSHILSTLNKFKNKTRTADALGITVKTLYNRLHKYGLFDQYRYPQK